MEFIADHGMLLLTMLILLGLSAFFSSSETALFSLGREQLRELEDNEGAIAAAIVRLAGDPANFLVTVLFGNLVVNVLFFCNGALAARTIGMTYGQVTEVVAGLVVLVLVIVFGEIIPKAIGVARPIALLRVTVLPFVAWYTLATPFRIVLRWLADQMEPEGASHEEFITPDELKMLLDLSHRTGNIEPSEREMIEGIVELAELRIREIMVPRVDIVAVDVATPVADVLRLAREQTFRHLPVYERTEENIIGVLPVRRLFLAADRETRTLRPWLLPVKFVPEGKRAESMLREFLAEHLDIAIAVDEYGGTAGLVTLEDLVEQFVGDIRDEFEQPEEPQVVELGSNSWRLQGRLSIREWRELFADVTAEAHPPELDTIGGFVVYLLGHTPHAGDRVRYRNLRFVVESVVRHRVETVRLELLEPEEVAA